MPTESVKWRCLETFHTSVFPLTQVANVWCLIEEKQQQALSKQLQFFKVWFQKSASSKIIPLKMFTARTLSPVTGKPHVPHCMCWECCKTNEQHTSEVPQEQGGESSNVLTVSLLGSSSFRILKKFLPNCLKPFMKRFCDWERTRERERENKSLSV